VIRTGKKKTRLLGVARAAELSVSAVSLALPDSPEISPETKWQVRLMSRRLGYRRPGETARTARRLERFGFLLIGAQLGGENESALLSSLAGRVYANEMFAAERIKAMADPPTAYMLTDVRTAASFLIAMKDSARPVAKESVVIIGARGVVRKYHMEDYPLLSCDTQAAAQTIMELLCRLHDQPRPRIGEILVPIVSEHLPDPLP